MYKVFIKESSVSFTNKHDAKAVMYKSRNQLFDIYQKLINTSKTRHYVISHANLSELWQAWISLFKLIEAAGGLVTNSRGEVLLIYRLGKWDLPKGKLEKGEDPEQGAIREVMEECAIQKPMITGRISDTYHTYRLGDQNIIKKTFWFHMKVEGVPEPKPQIEEDITEVIWCPLAQLESVFDNSYPNIVLIIKNLLQSQAES